MVVRPPFDPRLVLAEVPEGVEANVTEGAAAALSAPRGVPGIASRLPSLPASDVRSP